MNHVTPCRGYFFRRLIPTIARPVPIRSIVDGSGTGCVGAGARNRFNVVFVVVSGCRDRDGLLCPERHTRCLGGVHECGLDGFSCGAVIVAHGVEELTVFIEVQAQAVVQREKPQCQLAINRYCHVEVESSRVAHDQPRT